jgi:hypothetical protein
MFHGRLPMFSLLHRGNGKMYCFLVLVLVVFAVAAAVVVQIFIPYPILNSFLLTPYLFINNKCIKLYVDTLNVYRYQIFFYDTELYQFIDIK